MLSAFCLRLIAVANCLQMTALVVSPFSVRRGAEDCCPAVGFRLQYMLKSYP